MRRRWLRLIFVVVLAMSPLTLRGADGGLEPGDRLGVIGDSITEQKLYSVFIEDYLLMCQPAADLRRRSLVGVARHRGDSPPVWTTTCCGFIRPSSPSVSA